MKIVVFVMSLCACTVIGPFSFARGSDVCDVETVRGISYCNNHPGCHWTNNRCVPDSAGHAFGMQPERVCNSESDNGQVTLCRYNTGSGYVR